MHFSSVAIWCHFSALIKLKDSQIRVVVPYDVEIIASLMKELLRQS
jgi:hypothetical protein